MDKLRIIMAMSWLALALVACGSPAPIPSAAGAANAAGAIGNAAPAAAQAAPAALVYYWLERLPDGMEVSLAESSATEQRYTLVLSDPANPRRMLELSAGPNTP